MAVKALKSTGAALALATLATCGGPPARSVVTLRISTAAGALMVRAEVAATPGARARGLMGRSSVPPGTGMYFLFPKPARVGFWMKDTLVPLDIAFVRAGRVTELASMVPCREERCPLTTPSEPFEAALEVAAGGLAGVVPGAVVIVVGELPEPR